MRDQGDVMQELEEKEIEREIGRRQGGLYTKLSFFGG